MRCKVVLTEFMYAIYANVFVVVDLNYFVGNISDLSFYFLVILL